MLRDKRIAEDLTQAELAGLAAVGRQWLNAFEHGDKPGARLDMVMRVIAALDTAVSLGGPDRPPVPAGTDVSSDAAAPSIDLDALLAEFDR